MDKNVIIKKQIKCRIRKIRERYILIGLNKCYEINSIGKHIWGVIDGEKSVGEIISTIQNEYDMDHAIIERDTCAFLESLLSINAITMVS